MLVVRKTLPTTKNSTRCRPEGECRGGQLATRGGCLRCQFPGSCPSSWKCGPSTTNQVSPALPSSHLKRPSSQPGRRQATSSASPIDSHCDNPGKVSLTTHGLWHQELKANTLADAVSSDFAGVAPPSGCSPHRATAPFSPTPNLPPRIHDWRREVTRREIPRLRLPNPQ